jgi:hypothetical protein
MPQRAITVPVAVLFSGYLNPCPETVRESPKNHPGGLDTTVALSQGMTALRSPLTKTMSSIFNGVWLWL